MKHIKLSEDKQQRLVFYLAMEEYVAAHIADLLPDTEPGKREAFFMWQVPPTVIFGRNQVMEAEVNLPYCREKGIHLYRRKSGGGCVYSDMGNIMLSYISDSTDVAFTFDKFLQRLALALRRIGLDAERSGRNDVLVGGRKVSGNAFFLQPASSIVHGTLLFDSDFDELTRAITPSDAKIKSKGVESVRQHVTNVREELLAIGDTKYTEIGRFKEYILSSFCAGDAEIVLSGPQVDEIRKIEATYLDPDFLAGRHHSFSLERKGKIEGVGEIAVELQMEGDRIENCILKGDYFTLKDGVDKILSERLKGAGNTAEGLGKALEGIELADYVMGLKTGIFIGFMTSSGK